MNSLEQKIRERLKHTFAWELVGESGSVREGEEELINEVKQIAIELAREAFIAGGMHSTFKGFPGLEDTPDFETWLKNKL